MNLRTAIRRAAIVIFGALGLCCLGSGIVGLFSLESPVLGVIVLTELTGVIIFPAVFFSLAYFSWRRHYRPLCSLGAKVVAVLVFALLMGVARPFASDLRVGDDSLGSLLLNGLLSISALFMAVWMAREAHRHAKAFFLRRLGDRLEPEGQGSFARWLAARQIPPAMIGRIAKAFLGGLFLTAILFALGKLVASSYGFEGAEKVMESWAALAWLGGGVLRAWVEVKSIQREMAAGGQPARN